ncbi:MAG TPA: histidine triad nucleotide-binding protein [Desulfitobacteriaceae bacterium]|nr:histidine triad nucleotide-binding protein [Desulfitobacteriaceae bacterium]
MAECIFCKIVAKEIPAQIVYEDKDVLAFKDINPMAPVHLLIIPKKHYQDLNTAVPADESLLGHIITVAQKMAVEQGIAESGYRVVVNNGVDAGQIVDHLHFHVLGGHILPDFA